jgi:hypothetical protein
LTLIENDLLAVDADLELVTLSNAENASELRRKNYSA